MGVSSHLAHARSMAQAVEQLPHPALRPFIQRFLVVEFPAFHHDVHLPDTSPVAAFSFRGRCRIDGDQWAPLAAFTGLRETLRAHEHCHEHAVLLATFTPVGAAAFLRPSLEEFTGTTVDLAGILDRPGELDRLHEQLAGAQNHGRRIALLEDFLLARVRVSASQRRGFYRGGARGGLFRPVAFHQRLPPGNRQRA